MVTYWTVAFIITVIHSGNMKSFGYGYINHCNLIVILNIIRSTFSLPLQFS
ncbi:hypothetical protein KSS87_014779 [Heliosperma pusillum]|nr:hypothetical protein KSS87_014779 [Heliosperma pusillum]